MPPTFPIHIATKEKKAEYAAEIMALVVAPDAEHVRVLAQHGKDLRTECLWAFYRMIWGDSKDFEYRKVQLRAYLIQAMNPELKLKEIAGIMGRKHLANPKATASDWSRYAGDLIDKVTEQNMPDPRTLLQLTNAWLLKMEKKKRVLQKNRVGSWQKWCRRCQKRTTFDLTRVL